jgi:hypothetical protein
MQFAYIVANNDFCADPELEEGLHKGVFTHQANPGKMNNKISLPKRLEHAIRMQIASESKWEL